MEHELKSIAKEHELLEEERINLIHKTRDFEESAKKHLIESNLSGCLSVNWSRLNRYANRM